ncbi:MAG: PhaM family polyhydroxyalkanoate granule multifunctional regulatory protein [Hylemonella sp.]
MKPGASPTPTAVPGFDFLQQLAQGGAASWAQWVAPTLDAQALEQRIGELKAVQFWLDQNAAALKATIQALEVQKMTLQTLQSMNVPLGWPPGGKPAAQAAPTAAPAPAAAAAQTPAAPAAVSRPRAARRSRAAQSATPQSAPAAPLADPLQLWGALAQQFQRIAAQALQETAARAATATPAKPAGGRRRGSDGGTPGG